MGRQVLETLGPRDPASAANAPQDDERMLLEQHLVYDDEAALIASSEQARIDLERLFEADEMPLVTDAAPSRPLPLE